MRHARAEHRAAGGDRRAGRVFVSAGAGTGKTSVLVERFVRAVCDQGVDVDSILVITYTKRAAGELRARIRARAPRRGRADLARGLDGAWISTIHGFCNRLLKTYPFEAGSTRGSASSTRRSPPCSAARRSTRRSPSSAPASEPDRLQLLATYGARGLRRMLTGIYETLRSAGRPLVLELGDRPPLEERLAGLREAAPLPRRRRDATDLQRANAARRCSSWPPASRAGAAARPLRAPGARRARGDVRGRPPAVEQAALDELAAATATCSRSCSRRSPRVRSAKERESALDFEDLQLAARELLRDAPEIREREPLRFRAIMVDEFQDTNRLQCELIDLLADAGERDSSSSATSSSRSTASGTPTSGLPRAARRGGRPRAVAELPLAPEVLAAVNHLFRGEFGDEFQPLAASGEFPDPSSATRSSCSSPTRRLRGDRAALAARGGAAHRAPRPRARRRPARRRPARSCSSSPPAPTPSGTRRSCAAGLPTYRATGRGYFGQQQVVDLLAYLRLLQNRYDDQALVTVLASPFVGVSNDALVLIRRAGLGGRSSSGSRAASTRARRADDRSLRAFRQRYDRLAGRSPRLSLERLCEQIVAEHDYDLAVLAQWDGRRRYANLRKLARLARAYEELRGPDIEGFVRFVRDQEAVGAKELEAVAEEEGADAVRLLTIHAAKGLEFKVVVVADAGPRPAAPGADEILALSDGRFGFRVADPTTSEAPRRVRLRRGAAAAGRRRSAERLRLYYVAMTRAIDRLIVSGAVDRESTADRSTPMGWVLERLDADEELAAAAGPVELERDGAASWSASTASPSLAGRAAEPDVAGRSSPCSPRLAAPLRRPRRRCPSCPRSRRRRCTTCAGSRSRPSRSSSAARTGTSPSASRACARSTSTLRPRGAVGDRRSATRCTRCSRRRPRRARVPDVREERPRRVPGRDRRGRARRLAVERTAPRSSRARVAALDGVAKERHFRSSTTASCCTATWTLLHPMAARARRRLQDERARARRAGGDRRALVPAQRLVYALACFRAGADEVEVAYQFLERPDEPVLDVPRDQMPELEGDLSAAIARSARASSVRRRASSRAPAVPRSTSSAPGRACRSSRCRRRRHRRRVVRVAALYDVHGNLPALEAVLAEVGRGVDRIVVRRDAALARSAEGRSGRCAAWASRRHRRARPRERDAAAGVAATAWRRDRRARARARPGARRRRARPRALLTRRLGATRRSSPRTRRTRSWRDARRRGLDVVVSGHTHMQSTAASAACASSTPAASACRTRPPGAYWALFGPDVELRRTDYDLAAVMTGADRAPAGRRGRPREPARPAAARRRSSTSSAPGAVRTFVAEARRRVGPKRTRIGPIVERLATSTGRDDRAALPLAARAARLRDASAQTTDVNVNRVTEPLFEKYRRPEDYLAVPLEELERDIYATGFFRQKARSIRGTMRMLLEEFDGEVPRDSTSSRGCPASRKTANVVAAELGHPQGIVVDTHVGACPSGSASRRQEDPVKIERDLIARPARGLGPLPAPADLARPTRLRRAGPRCERASSTTSARRAASSNLPASRGKMATMKGSASQASGSVHRARLVAGVVLPSRRGYPSSMASTGDSITRAFNDCSFPFVDCPAASWSTGTSSAVNSHYRRILAANRRSPDGTPTTPHRSRHGRPARTGAGPQSRKAPSTSRS